MDTKPDDLDAVRVLCKTLEPFPAEDRERIIRWAREKLGLKPTAAPESKQVIKSSPEKVEPDRNSATDIKTFALSKGNTTNNQFAAVVAYYYRFEAPEGTRKDGISADDLQEACRLVGRQRLGTPAQTLINSRNAGLLDKGDETGTYKINTVGENLVAMTLPASDGKPAARRTPAKRSKKQVKGSKKADAPKPGTKKKQDT